MSRALNIAALGIASFLVPACYSTYTGIYFLNRTQEVSRAQIESVVRALYPVVERFGLSEMRQSEGNPVLLFTSGQNTPSPALENLAGSEARVSVAVRLDRPSITIRDMSNADATTFVEALKEAIESQLKANGISNARFERQKDFLFY